MPEAVQERDDVYALEQRIPKLVTYQARHYAKYQFAKAELRDAKDELMSLRRVHDERL